MVQCNACGGTYEPIGRDGVPYYHTCPPITVVPVLRDGKPLLVPLEDLRDSDLVRVRRGAAQLSVAKKNLQPDDVRLGDTTRERPNARDERPVITFVDGKVTSTAAAEGAGVSEVDADAIAEPVVFPSSEPSTVSTLDVEPIAEPAVVPVDEPPTI